MKKYNMLVSFTKYKDNNYELETIEVQYHYFRNCPKRLEFVHDPLFKMFLKKGYWWTAMEFPKELADKCMFTQSKYQEEVKK